MTEHKKIPVPPGQDARDGVSENSLIERLGGGGGLKGFQITPVPRNLALPRPIGKRRTDAPKAAVLEPMEPFIDQSDAAQPMWDAAAPAERPVVPAAERAPVAAAASTELNPAFRNQHIEPVEFSGARQAIDRAGLRDAGFLVPEAGSTKLFEEIRIIKRQVLQAIRDGIARGHGSQAQRVLVCSPLPGDGKTFTAVNLAMAIAAERDSEVLLVDADFAKPSVLSALGLTGRLGLMDALTDPQIKVEDCVIRTDMAGLSVLPAGTQSSHDSENLASASAIKVVERLTQGTPNRVVIFDSPPALAASPAAELAGLVGQSLLVARAGTTAQSSLEDAVQLLADCADIKLVLNAAYFSPSGRRFGTYYGYGG